MTVYVVKSGDTVNSIAAKFGIGADFLAKDNQIPVTERLAVGQTLVIRFPSQTYRIVKGDTLYSIASRFGVTVNSLFRANLYLKGSTAIIPGEELVIRFDGEPYYKLEVGGYAYPFISGELLKTVLPFMDRIVPFTYGINANGELIDLDDRIMLNEAFEYGASPYMHLSTLDGNDRFSSENAVNVITSESAKNELIKNVTVNMTEKGYYGADVDFEYIPPEYKNDYVRFLDEMRKALNERSFTMMAALAPKTYDEQPGLLYEAHDYEAIGNASDEVLLMTYEWGYTYSEPMAVSPINNVRRVIEYAITKIPARKIFLGMSNYGYDWKLPYEKGVTRAISLSTDQAFKLASEKNAVINYDETAQAPYFFYKDDEGNDHAVWFEDARSLSARISLAAEYGLKGIMYWNLMRKNPQNLTLIDSLIIKNNNG